MDLGFSSCAKNKTREGKGGEDKRVDGDETGKWDGNSNLKQSPKNGRIERAREEGE